MIHKSYIFFIVTGRRNPLFRFTIFQKEQFSHDSLSFLRFVCPTGSKAL